MADFDGQAVVRAWHSLLETVVIMSGDTPDRVRRAPVEGWSLQPQHITKILSVKTPGVLDLIKKLSYCDDLHVALDTRPLNYISPEGLEMKDGTSPLSWSDPDNPADVLPEELPMTTQNDGVGSLLILNVITGICRIVTDTMSRPECTVHIKEPPNCPPLCRHAHALGTSSRPVLEVLEEWRQNFLGLKWMVDSAPDVFDEVHGYDPWEKKVELMKQIYRDHGWPDLANFRGSKAREALEDLPDADDMDEMSSESQSNDDS